MTRGTNSEISTPSARTSGDAAIAHAHQEASVTDLKVLQEHQQFVHTSPGESLSRQAAENVVAQQIDGKNPFQIVDHHAEGHQADEHAEDSKNTKDEKKDDHKSGDKSGAEHSGKHASEYGLKGGGGGSTALEDDPATLLRRHHMEMAQGLGLAPDASDAEIDVARHALNMGLASTATQAEIDQRHSPTSEQP